MAPPIVCQSTKRLNSGPLAVRTPPTAKKKQRSPKVWFVFETSSFFACALPILCQAQKQSFRLWASGGTEKPGAKGQGPMGKGGAQGRGFWLWAETKGQWQGAKFQSTLGTCGAADLGRHNGQAPERTFHAGRCILRRSGHWRAGGMLALRARPDSAARRPHHGGTPATTLRADGRTTGHLAPTTPGPPWTGLVFGISLNFGFWILNFPFPPRPPFRQNLPNPAI
jgi:hypothetical protein